MRVAIVQNVLVYLVRHHQDVAVPNEIRERIQVLAGRDGTGRIVRCVEKNEAGTRGDCRAHAIPVIAEPGRKQWQADTASAGQSNRGLVGIVGRIEGDGFVSQPKDGLDA